MTTKEILKKVENYKSFLTLDELNVRAHELASKYNFEIKEAGKSAQGRTIYVIKAGNGQKKAFIWGFPHPNEPIGSLTIDFLINYLGKNPDKLEALDYTWYFIYTADPDGTLMNEGWFKGNLTLERYALNFFRQSADKMIDWTFPVKYKDFKWDSPTPETKVLMRVIQQIKPDLMYPLHNSGFGGAYFLSSTRFSDSYYNELLKSVKELDIPLHLGEPEEEFMREIVKPFYYDFSFKDYYENKLKLGDNPLDLKHGDNSTGYLLSLNPRAVVIKGEIPYFFDNKIFDENKSDRTRREVWLKRIEISDNNMKFYSEIVPKIMASLDASDIDYPIIKQLERNIHTGNKSIKTFVLESKDFDRKATNSEVFDNEVISQFYTSLFLGQLKRTAIKAGISRDEINEIEKRLHKCTSFVDKNSNWKVLPIKKLVQLQLLLLFETINAMEA